MTEGHREWVREPAIVVTDPAGRITTFSPGAERLTGRAAADVIGHPSDFLLDPAELAARARNGRPTDSTVGCQDGSIRLTVTALPDGAGFVVVGITAHEQTETNVEERFNELANNIDVGFALRSIEPAEFTYVNPAYRRIFGLDPAGPVPTTNDTLAILDPGDRARGHEVLRRVIGGEPVEDEWRFTRADGTRGWMRARISPIRDEDGTVRRIAGMFEDISERRAAEAVLAESQERFHELADNVDLGFTVRQLDPPAFLYLNPAYRRIFAFPETGTPDVSALLDRIHPDDREKAVHVIDEIARSVEGTRARDYELRVVRPDGTERAVRFMSRPVADPDGAVRRAATIVEDITERRKIETAVRTAQAEAERANAAKDEFLSRMSHELRTPLNAVLGFAQLLEFDALNPRQTEAVSHIVRGGEHLVGMIDDILDITGIEADRLTLSLEAVAVAEVVDQTVGLMQTLAAAGGVTLAFEPGPRPGRFVRADRRRLQQILLNLVSNAIKYNHPGGRVGVVVSGDAATVDIAVTDNGMGIPARDLPRLFSAFDRLGRQASTIEGTGIGLLLAKRLAGLMGGTIAVRTEEGVGSTFTVRLPADRSVLGTSGGAEPDDPPAVIDGAERRVVYIEDNPSNAQLMHSIVERRPAWAMTHVTTGADGLAAVHEVGPELILLDLHLPDTDGREVLRALRADPATAAVPVAVLSADANPKQIGRMLAAGACAYLTKPLNVRELLGLFDEHAAGALPGPAAGGHD